MKEYTRLAIALLFSAVLVAGVLAWLQWPLDDSDPEMQARLERIEQLRTAVERELEELQATRERRETTEKELEELRDSLDERRREVERLEEELEEQEGNHE